MAQFVGKQLRIRPNDILDSWGVPELIVTYGKLANDISQENYSRWELNKQGPAPKKIFVRFYKGI